jgi:deoxynucleoside kinase
VEAKDTSPKSQGIDPPDVTAHTVTSDAGSGLATAAVLTFEPAVCPSVVDHVSATSSSLLTTEQATCTQMSRSWETDTCTNDTVTKPNIVTHERMMLDSSLLLRSEHNESNPVPDLIGLTIDRSFVTMCTKSIALTTKDRIRQILESEQTHTVSTTDHVFTIVVEGNIGAGKTTFLNHFRNITTIDVYEEPVSRWQNVNGHNLLEQLYNDPLNSSHAFQSYVMLTMLEQHRHKSKKLAKIMERSIFSAKHCFIKHMQSTAIMNARDYTILCKWFEYLTNDPQFNTKVDLVIYLQTDPQIAYERQIKRNRSEESAMKFSYIRELHQLHEDWLINDPSTVPSVPVLVLNGNKDVKSYKAESDTILSEVIAHLTK